MVDFQSSNVDGHVDHYILILCSMPLTIIVRLVFKEALYRIWCGVNRLGDSGVNILGDTSAFVNPAG